jgi:hypothetical protein
MDLLAGMILFSAAGAWLAARARAAGAALAFGVVGAVLFCATPLGSRVPALIGNFVQGTAVVGGQFIDGHAQGKDPGDTGAKPVRGHQ